MVISVFVFKRQVELSPIENAYTSMEAKTIELLEIIESVERVVYESGSTESVNTSQLAMNLNGTQIFF